MFRTSYIHSCAFINMPYCSLFQCLLISVYICNHSITLKSINLLRPTSLYTTPHNVTSLTIFLSPHYLHSHLPFPIHLHLHSSLARQPALLVSTGRVRGAGRVRTGPQKPSKERRANRRVRVMDGRGAEARYVTQEQYMTTHLTII